MPIRRSDYHTKAEQGRGLQALALVGAAALLVVALAACASETPAPTPSPPPPPTARPTTTPRPLPTTAPEPTVETPYDFMSVSPLSGKPQESPEATFELYLRDSISQTERLQQKRVALRLRYEVPNVTTQDLPGLVIGVKLMEDRSTYTLPTENTAVYMGDFDVQVTFADQSTGMRYCAWTVNLERVRGTWYVINPSELPLFSVCLA